MKSQQDRYNWRCSPEKFQTWLRKDINLVIASMFVQKRNDRFDVVLLDDVKHLRTFNKDTIQHLQNAWQLEYAHIHYSLKYIFKKKSFQSARTH